MIVATAMCYLFYGLLAASLALLDWQALEWLPGTLAVLLGILIADLLSGVLHIYLDYVPFREDIDVARAYFYPGKRNTDEYRAVKNEIFRQLGPIDRSSYNFKIHHARPKAMNRKFYPLHAAETMPAAFVAVVLSFFLPAEFALGAAVVAFLAINIQFIHSCIHDTRKSVFWKKIIQRLQRLHIIYSLETHMAHHRDGDRNFCLITGWGNVILNPVCAELFRRGILKRELWETLKLPERQR